MAVAAINVGEMQVRVVVTLPAILVRVAAAGMRQPLTMSCRTENSR